MAEERDIPLSHNADIQTESSSSFVRGKNKEAAQIDDRMKRNRRISRNALPITCTTFVAEQNSSFWEKKWPISWKNA